MPRWSPRSEERRVGKEENTHTHAQFIGNYRFDTANEIILQSLFQLDN